jgi:hypothetical protein
VGAVTAPGGFCYGHTCQQITATPALQSVTAKIAFFQDLSTEGVGRQSKTRFELTMKVTEVGTVKLTGVQACC